MSEMKLAFMSWVCPGWDVGRIVDGAKRHGYQGVELRVGSGHAHGIDKETPQDEVRRAGLAFRESGIEVCAIATSCRFSMQDAKERAQNVDDLKAYIGLAQALGCGRVRVFGGKMPDGIEPAGVVDQVADAISDALDVAAQARVQILVETHDSFSHTPYVRELMSQLYSDFAGVVWDVAHPLRHFERIDDSFDDVADYIRHVHVHDITYNEDRTKIKVVGFGQGMVPFDRMVSLLSDDGYEGYLSVEVMEGDPDEVLADYAQGLSRLTGAEPEEQEEPDAPPESQKETSGPASASREDVEEEAGETEGENTGSGQGKKAPETTE